MSLACDGKSLLSGPVGGGIELAETKSKRMSNFDPDNPDQQMIHNCMKWARRHLNPIIDWSSDEVWEFIHTYNVPYCCLYDQGFKRLGCIGCPMGTTKHREMEFRRWPKYKKAYLSSFGRMIEKNNKSRDTKFDTPENTFDWWMEKEKTTL